MNEKKKQEIPMPFKFDDFFTTQEQRDDAVKEKIEEIDISLIDNFKDHPFKVLDNDDMKSLKERIRKEYNLDNNIHSRELMDILSNNSDKSNQILNEYILNLKIPLLQSLYLYL